MAITLKTKYKLHILLKVFFLFKNGQNFFGYLIKWSVQRQNSRSLYHFRRLSKGITLNYVNDLFLLYFIGLYLIRYLF